MKDLIEIFIQIPVVLMNKINPVSLGAATDLVSLVAQVIHLPVRQLVLIMCDFSSWVHFMQENLNIL